MVAEFGGRVDKILGDGMLVLFGAPVAHEDDPERAVRAALRMQETLGAHVAATGLAGSDDVRMRVGINTGEVLVGTLAGTDYTAMGDVVNIASRLQAAAPPGGVLVGETTHGLTSHTFHYEPAGELQARGREQTVHVLAGGRRPPPRPVPGGGAGATSCFVGPHHELAIVDGAIDLVDAARPRRCCCTSTARTAWARAASSTRSSAASANAGDVTVLEGACVPYGESNVWWPFANALSDLPRPRAGPARRRRARRGAVDVPRSCSPPSTATERELLVDVFLHLLGFPSPIDKLDPASARSTIHHTVAQVLDAKAEKAPIVLSIDDLHWADPVLLELLESPRRVAQPPAVRAHHRHAARQPTSPGRRAPTAAPSCRSRCSRSSRDGDRRPGPRAAAATDDTDEPRLAALLRPQRRQPAVPHRARRAHRGRRRPASCPTRCARSSLPASTSSRCSSARCSRTPPCSAPPAIVIGLEQFAAALGQPPPDRPSTSSTSSGCWKCAASRWEFRSESVRDAAYQTLTKAARAQRHAGVAKVMYGTGDTLDDVAHHAASAAELVQELGPVDKVPADIAERAVRALTAAADRALESGSLRTAVRHATRAHRPAARRRPTTIAVAHLRIVRASAEIDQRQFDAAAADLDALARAIAERTRRPATLRPRRTGCAACSPTSAGGSTTPGASWAAPSTCCARPSDPTCWPARCACAVSSRCSPARWPTPSGSSARPTSCTASSATNAASPTSSSTGPGSPSSRATSPSPANGSPTRRAR